MPKETVLIIEDEPDITELVEYNLARDGFVVHAARNGEEGLHQAFAHRPDVILLDIMLPGMDGLEVCRQLRQRDETKRASIIMLTARSEESDVVLGLGLGADDYVTKPFSPKELIARIHAVLRRRGGKVSDEQDHVKLGPIVIDAYRHEVFLRGSRVPFTLAEFRLLKTLAANPGRVFTRDQLLDKITNGESIIIDRNVDVHIRAIRKKLGTDGDYILTVRGVGYKARD